MMDQHARRGAGAGNRHPHAQSAIRRGPSQLVGDRTGVAKQPLKAVEIKRDDARSAHLDARRELARHRVERIERTIGGTV